MKTKFTAPELRLAQTFSESYSYIKKRLCKETPYDDVETVVRNSLKLAGQASGIRGTIHFGGFRSAYVTKSFVIKVPYQYGDGSSLTKEFHFINKMKKNETFSRHFPLTIMVANGVLLQERIRLVNASSMKKYEDSVLVLGERLGIDDVKGDNYGWAGPKGSEWPVFIDVDFRISKVGRPARVRSWMVPG